MKNYRNEKGVTLVEMVVAMAIFVSCMSIAVTMLITSQRIYANTSVVNKAHDRVRATVDHVSYAVRSSLIQPIILNEGTPVGIGVSGNVLKLIRNGYYTQLASNTMSGMSYIYITETNGHVSPATINRLKGSQPTEALTDVATLYDTNQTPRTSLGVGWVCMVDQTWTTNIMVGTSTVAVTTPVNLVVTNLTTENGTLRLELNKPLPTTLTKGTRVILGYNTYYEIASYKAANNTIMKKLLYYDGLGNSKVLVDNLSPSQADFTSSNGFVIVDLQYDSLGDVSGRGIYRIKTEAAPRANPAFSSGNPEYIGQYEEPANGQVFGD